MPSGIGAQKMDLSLMEGITKQFISSCVYNINLEKWTSIAKTHK